MSRIGKPSQYSHIVEHEQFECLILRFVARHTEGSY